MHYLAITIPSLKFQAATKPATAAEGAPEHGDLGRRPRRRLFVVAQDLQRAVHASRAGQSCDEAAAAAGERQPPDRHLHLKSMYSVTVGFW